MSTGSLSDVDDELLDGILKFGSSGKDSGTSNESTGESSNCEGGSANDKSAQGKKRKTGSGRKTALNGVAHDGGGKQPQRNAANARERARMRVLSKAFSRLKTTLPWVPPDTKLSKLDTLRLASSYIAHLRQILANDKYENGFIHPVNLVRDTPQIPQKIYHIYFIPPLISLNVDLNPCLHQQFSQSALQIDYLTQTPKSNLTNTVAMRNSLSVDITYKVSERQKVY